MRRFLLVAIFVRIPSGVPPLVRRELDTVVRWAHAFVGVSSFSASSFERGAGTGVADLFYPLLTPTLAWCTLCNLVLFAIAKIVPHSVSWFAARFVC